MATVPGTWRKTSRLPPDGGLRWAIEDEVAAVLAVDLLQRLAHVLLHPLEAALHVPQLVLEVQNLLDAREVEPDLGRQALDQAQPLDVELRVETRVAGGALRL